MEGHGAAGGGLAASNPVRKTMLTPAAAGAHPQTVSDDEVERSNRILSLLRETSSRFPDLRTRLGALPMFALARVGAMCIAIVHGDAESLAGWRFAHDSLDAAAMTIDTADFQVYRLSSGRALNNLLAE